MGVECIDEEPDAIISFYHNNVINKVVLLHELLAHLRCVEGGKLPKEIARERMGGKERGGGNS